MRTPTGLAFALMILGLPAVPRADESPAAKVITQLDATLLDVMRNAATLGFQGRIDKLGPAVDAAFDLPFMAEKSLGQDWQTLSDADKQRWIKLSREFSIANFAANFDHAGEQTITLVGEEPSAAETVLVKTKINDPKGENVEMNYRLRALDGTWRIVDIYLKGTVSELALRRADYTALLEKDGFDALAKTMQRKIAELADGTAKR